MFYTGKGDDGTTSFFDSTERISKNSLRAEALGAIDELNSLLGICKIHASNVSVLDESLSACVFDIQQGLFIVQVVLAGAIKKMPKKRILEMERLIQNIEKELPPITTFFISGGTELAALFDFSRAVARRAERRVISWEEESKIKLEPEILQFLNRTSSVLYAFARYANFRAGISEEKPKYK